MILLVVPADAGAAVLPVVSTEAVSVAANGDGGNADSSHAAPSADGRYVAFQSAANNLAPGDSNGQMDISEGDRRVAPTVPHGRRTTGG